MRCVGVGLSPTAAWRPVSPERDPLPSSGHWGVGGPRPLAAGSCVGLFLTVPRIAHQEMRGTTASPHGLPQTPKDMVCVKRTCEALAQHSRASRRRFSQRPHGRARPEVPAAVPASGQCGVSPTRRAPVGTARGAARGRGSAHTAVRGAEAKACCHCGREGDSLPPPWAPFLIFILIFKFMSRGLRVWCWRCQASSWSLRSCVCTRGSRTHFVI